MVPLACDALNLPLVPRLPLSAYMGDGARSRAVARVEDYFRTKNSKFTP